MASSLPFVALLTWIPSAAESANGAVVFHSDRDGGSEIYRIAADGTGNPGLTRPIAISEFIEPGLRHLDDIVDFDRRGHRHAPFDAVADTAAACRDIAAPPPGLRCQRFALVTASRNAGRSFLQEVDAFVLPATLKPPVVAMPRDAASIRKLDAQRIERYSTPFVVISLVFATSILDIAEDGAAAGSSPLKRIGPPASLPVGSRYCGSVSKALISASRSASFCAVSRRYSCSICRSLPGKSCAPSFVVNAQ